MSAKEKEYYVGEREREKIGHPHGPMLLGPFTEQEKPNPG